MKKILLFTIVCLLSFPAMATAAIRPPAEPVSALFYPNEVQVTVEERLLPEKLPGSKGFVLSLPVRAVPNSFSVTVNGVPAGSYYLLNREEDILPLEQPDNAAEKPDRPYQAATRPDQEANPDRKVLLQAMVDIRVEMEKYSADINTAQERISLWKNYSPDEMELKPADLITLDKAMSELMPGLFAAKSQGERMLRDAQDRLAEAERALYAYDSGFAPQSRLVAVVPYTEQAGKPCVVRYTYILPGSYRSFYHLGAFPAKNNLTIEQNAALYQTSGFTWNDVEVFISTTGRDTALQPSPVYPWQISLGTPYAAEPRMRKEMAPAAMGVNMFQMSNSELSLDEKSMVPEVPTQAEMGTFRLWSIGKRTIDSGMPVNVSMAKESYEVKFYYTLRPSQSGKGFLTAELNLDKALELPHGQARFFVDNSLVGENTIALNGSKATLYFGTDPQVTVTRKDVKRSTGEQGFISKEQTMLWHWEISVRNTRSRSIEAWVEEPLPESLDDSITVTVEATPKPEEFTLKPQQGGSKIYRWKFTLEPNESQSIDYKVQLTAPSDKVVNPGRHN